MSLRVILERILSLLSQNPNAEHQADLKACVSKLQLAAVGFQEAFTRASAQNSVSYAKLAGLLTDPTKKKVVTVAWANSHLRRLKQEEISGKSMTATARDKFLLRVVSANGAEEIIKELTRSEDETFQDEFAALSKLSKSEAENTLNEFKGPKLELFCKANSVPVAKKITKKTGKATLDRKKTIEGIQSALVDFRERQKL